MTVIYRQTITTKGKYSEKYVFILMGKMRVESCLYCCAASNAHTVCNYYIKAYAVRKYICAFRVNFR